MNIAFVDQRVVPCHVLMPGSLSHTTRHVREDEADGDRYHHVTQAQMDSMIERGELLQSCRCATHLMQHA